jgi:SAM-dependent methyltransferase
LLHQVLPIASVLDVGCGAGAWLAAHGEAGVGDLTGVDGDYVERSLLLFEPDRFEALDIAAPFDLRRSFDLVQCLEVGEHVVEPLARSLIDNLVRHGQVVLFSAAPPGQGGKGHINEQPIAYWRDLFAERGYSAFDYLRPLIAHDRRIEWWYRYNTLLYVHEAAISALPTVVRRTEVALGAPVPDFSPMSVKLRKRVLKRLPSAAVDWLAVRKHRRIVRRLRRP